MMNNADVKYDRLSKYGYGIIRLALLWLGFFLFPPFHNSNLAAENLFSAYRYLGFMYLGSIGAVVNVKSNFWVNISLLAGAVVYCLYDINLDNLIVVYLIKTFSGDYLTGKLDTKEWKVVFFLIFGLLVPGLCICHALRLYEFSEYKVTLWLFIIQFICEYGDNYLESLIFFRHRYSFEILNLLLLVVVKLDSFEYKYILADLFICLFYRIANFTILLYDNYCIVYQLKCLIFSLYGLLRGINTSVVTDPAVAMAVLKSSTNKGAGIEKYIANNAWKPILSLESVDGELWIQMRKDFDKIITHLPPLSKFIDIIKKHSNIKNFPPSTIIDANVVAKVTVQIFLEYLFDKVWEPKFNVFVEASWEWRKEIAMRGTGSEQTKHLAVNLIISLILESATFFPIFGSGWKVSKYYSLILQPFIISPCINVTDIMVALKTHPSCTVDEAVRLMHPFPILERFVTDDVYVNGTLQVQRNTQVLMFTTDFNQTKATWPIFGIGARSCAGSQFATPLLKIMQSEWLNASNFKPDINHRYSGRNNDSNTTFSEIFYFITTLCQGIKASIIDGNV